MSQVWNQNRPPPAAGPTTLVKAENDAHRRSGVAAAQGSTEAAPPSPDQRHRERNREGGDRVLLASPSQEPSFPSDHQ
jgi:hypothetical protein